MINLLMCSACMVTMHGGQDPQPHHDSAESQAGTAPPPSPGITRTGGTNTVVQVRTSLPRPCSDRLDHLGIELGLSKARLLQEAVLLLLRFYDRGAGLPEPIDALRPVAEVYDGAGQRYCDQVSHTPNCGLGIRTNELREPIAPQSTGESDGK